MADRRYTDRFFGGKSAPEASGLNFNCLTVTDDKSSPRGRGLGANKRMHWGDMALELCGNAGQIASIESIGWDFDNAYEVGINSNGDFSSLDRLLLTPNNTRDAGITDILESIKSSMVTQYSTYQAGGNLVVPIDVATGKRK